MRDSSPLAALDWRFVSLLAEPFRLRAVGHTLHDDSLEVRLVAVPLLGQLSELNPAVAMVRPRGVEPLALCRASEPLRLRLQLAEPRRCTSPLALIPAPAFAGC